MTSPRMLAVSVLVAAASLSSFGLGCEPVPDIRFVDDDGGTDGGARDGSADAAALCKSPSPGAGATCCGAVWCVDDCGKANCDECARKGCAAGELCCGKSGNVVCKDRCP